MTYKEWNYISIPKLQQSTVRCRFNVVIFFKFSQQIIHCSPVDEMSCWRHTMEILSRYCPFVNPLFIGAFHLQRVIAQNVLMFPLLLGLTSYGTNSPDVNDLGHNCNLMGPQTMIIAVLHAISSYITSCYNGTRLYITSSAVMKLQWRHNGLDGVSNNQSCDFLLNRLFRRRSKKTSKLRATGLYARNWPKTGEFPSQRASNAENLMTSSWDNCKSMCGVSGVSHSVQVYVYNCMTRDHFEHAPNQWEATIHCNIVSHWLSAYTNGSCMTINSSEKLSCISPLWGESITYPFAMFNGCIFEVRKWISNLSPHFITDVINHSCLD